MLSLHSRVKKQNGRPSLHLSSQSLDFQIKTIFTWLWLPFVFLSGEVLSRPGGADREGAEWYRDKLGSAGEGGCGAGEGAPQLWGRCVFWFYHSKNPLPLPPFALFRQIKPNVDKSETSFFNFETSRRCRWKHFALLQPITSLQTFLFYWICANCRFPLLPRYLWCGVVSWLLHAHTHIYSLSAGGVFVCVCVLGGDLPAISITVSAAKWGERHRQPTGMLLLFLR